MYASVVNVLRSVKITKIDKNVVLSSSSSEKSYRIYPITTTELEIYIQLCCCTYTADAVMFLFATNVLCYFQNQACNNAESCTVVIVIARQGIATNITHTHTQFEPHVFAENILYRRAERAAHASQPMSTVRRCRTLTKMQMRSNSKREFITIFESLAVLECTVHAKSSYFGFWSKFWQISLGANWGG